MEDIIETQRPLRLMWLKDQPRFDPSDQTAAMAWAKNTGINASNISTAIKTKMRIVAGLELWLHVCKDDPEFNDYNTLCEEYTASILKDQKAFDRELAQLKVYVEYTEDWDAARAKRRAPFVELERQMANYKVAFLVDSDSRRKATNWCRSTTHSTNKDGSQWMVSNFFDLEHYGVREDTNNTVYYFTDPKIAMLFKLQFAA